MTTIKPNALFLADCLSVMERIGSGEITLVYLDPPWDFPHEFLWKVLLQSRRVLDSQGSLFFHSDSRLAGLIRPMLDQAFGADRFVNEYIWSHRTQTAVTTTATRMQHEPIWVYAKSEDFIRNEVYRPFSDEETKSRFSSEDERGRFQLVSLTSPYPRPRMQFEWRGYLPHPGQSWRYSLDKLEQLESNGMIHWAGCDAFPREKRYLSEHAGVPIGTIWDDISSLLPHKRQRAQQLATQKPLDLAARIIRLASNLGDTVLDPFCGSGTTLLAAQENRRRWIGTDNNPDAVSHARSNLRQIGLTPASGFLEGDQEYIRTEWKAIPYYYRPQVRPTDISSSPLVITEGKTDWQHLKAAFSRLRGKLYRNFDIEFLEYGDELQMGSGELLNLCKQLRKMSNFRKVICIFDRDLPDTVKKVTGANSVCKSWGNDVYSFAVPVPAHRTEYPDCICVEMYYKDSEIMRKDENGRRLFLSTEFRETGRHNRHRSVICPKVGVSDSKKLSIISEEVFDVHDKNIALPKSDFAEFVMSNKVGFNHFDVSEFRRIFDIIIEISMI